MYQWILELAPVKTHRLRPSTDKFSGSQLQHLIFGQLIIGKRKIFALMRAATLGALQRGLHHRLSDCDHGAQLETVLHVEIERLLRSDAKFGILIGEKDCWGKGYGTETALLMLDYGFTGLGLHNIMLRTDSFNERGVGAYLRAGFREIGRRREAVRVAGRRLCRRHLDGASSALAGPAG